MRSIRVVKWVLMGLGGTVAAGTVAQAGFRFLDGVLSI